MSGNRMHFPNTVHFITNRTEHETFLLLPTERVTQIIQGWFARALCQYGEGLEIYAFIFLSNHFHLLVNDTKGTLAAFLWYFQSNVAKAINEEIGRAGHFWSRAYDDLTVVEDPELLDRYAYTVANAVKAGLVNKAEDWIGWNSLHGALGDGKYCFELLNRTKLHTATRRGQKVDVSEFMEKWEFALTPPPFLQGKTDDERRQYIQELMNSAEAEYRAKRGNKPPLGIEKIMQQRPTDRPLNPSFRPRIKVLFFDKQKRLDWLDRYRKFVDGYREIFNSYREASAKRSRPLVAWPAGSYPPSCWHPIVYADAA